MGTGSLAARGGRRVAKEAGHVAGMEAIQGWGRFINANARGVQRHVAIQTGRATQEEMTELKELFRARLGEMTSTEYAEQMRRWQLRSRWHYVAALLLVCIAIGFQIADASGWPMLNTMGLAALNFARGLTCAYRFWQMQTQTSFVEGAFWKWWQQGMWLV